MHIALKLFITNPETPKMGSCEAGYFAPDDGKPHRNELHLAEDEARICGPVVEEEDDEDDLVF